MIDTFGISDAARGEKVVAVVMTVEAREPAKEKASDEGGADRHMKKRGEEIIVRGR
jgi:hypothetical protein